MCCKQNYIKSIYIYIHIIYYNYYIYVYNNILLSICKMFLYTLGLREPCTIYDTQFDFIITEVKCYNFL